MSGLSDTTQILDLNDQGGAAPQAVSNFHVMGKQSPPSVAASPASQGMPSTNVFVTDVHVVKSGMRPEKIALSIVAGLLTVLCLGLAFVYFESGEFPDIFGFFTGDSPKVAQVPPAKQQPVETPQSTTPPAPATAPGPVSIWNQLTNELGGPLPELEPQFASDQFAAFSERIHHQYTYQRYAAVIEIASKPTRGAEELLRQALDSPKLWTKMRALMAIADLGEAVSDQDIQNALSGSHPELQANFFKRFERSPCSVGCFFVARASLPFIEPVARAAVIRVIAREESRVRDLYLVAATFDSAENVRIAAREALDSHPVTQKEIWDQVRGFSAH